MDVSERITEMYENWREKWHGDGNENIFNFEKWWDEHNDRVQQRQRARDRSDVGPGVGGTCWFKVQDNESHGQTRAPAGMTASALLQK